MADRILVLKNGELIELGTHEELLEKEGIKVKKDTVVNFKQLFWDPAKELI